MGVSGEGMENIQRLDNSGTRPAQDAQREGMVLEEVSCGSYTVVRLWIDHHVGLFPRFDRAGEVRGGQQVKP